VQADDESLIFRPMSMLNQLSPKAPRGFNAKSFPVDHGNDSRPKPMTQLAIRDALLARTSCFVFNKQAMHQLCRIGRKK
jgi:hypothetical protein